MLKKLLAALGLVALASCTEYVPPPAPVGYVLHFPGISLNIGGPAYVVRTYGAPQAPVYMPQPYPNYPAYPSAYGYAPRPVHHRRPPCQPGYGDGYAQPYPAQQYAPNGVPVPQYGAPQCQQYADGTYNPYP
jgi:hypothetical protein